VSDIRLVAVDMDGTFCRSDHTYDERRFGRILERMREVGCRFVVASGNQYFQLRDFFPERDGELGFVAENGALVTDGREPVFAAAIDRPTTLATLDWIESRPDIISVMSCLDCAYVERGRMSEEVFAIMGIYYHRLAWADSLRDVDGQVLKFALGVPEERTLDYYDEIRGDARLALEPTTSGHGAIDLIVPGCHKASGLELLARRWGIDPADCAAFGDGGNDIEMLEYVGHPFAMANAAEDVKRAAGAVCPSNDEDGVLVTLEELLGM
jgi:Cof subfamily protein (haloacid dehalogenase superfamily)